MRTSMNDSTILCPECMMSGGAHKKSCSRAPVLTKTLTRYVFCANESPHIRESPVGVWVRHEDARAEIEQLRGNLSLAEEGLASETQQIEKLTQELETTASALRGTAEFHMQACLECDRLRAENDRLRSQLETAIDSYSAAERTDL